MELETTRKIIRTVDTVFDDFVEQPVDCDFMMPDYLPDIAAILKCEMLPCIQTHQVSGDRVMADGTVTLRVLYLDEGRKCVRCFEVSQPFSCAFTVRDMNGGAVPTLTVKVNYVNCRATSPRRVDIHGSFSVCLTVEAECGTEVLTEIPDNEVFTRCEQVAYTVPAAQSEKTFSINEVADINGTEAMEMLVRTGACATVTECKQMPGKCIVKGNLIVTATYITDSTKGCMKRTEHQIPYSQIVDAEGMTEDATACCTATVLSCDVHSAQNPNGENKLLAIVAKVLLTVRAYAKEEDTVIMDAYHLRYPLKSESTRLELGCLTSTSHDMATIRLSMELPAGDVAAVDDLWCEKQTVNCRCEDGNTVAEGQLLIGMLARDSEEILSYYERTANFALNYPGEAEEQNFALQILSTDYTLSGNRLEISLQTAVDRSCRSRKTVKVLTAAVSDESSPYAVSQTMRGCTLKAYFAGEGESVWEIAKAQHISAEALAEENALTGDVLTAPTALLIPLR